MATCRRRGGLRRAWPCPRLGRRPPPPGGGKANPLSELRVGRAVGSPQDISTAGSQSPPNYPVTPASGRRPPPAGSRPPGAESPESPERPCRTPGQGLGKQVACTEPVTDAETSGDTSRRTSCCAPDQQHQET